MQHIAYMNLSEKNIILVLYLLLILGQTVYSQDNLNELSVVREEMSVEDAKQKGAQAVFDDKYGNTVSVYSAGNFCTEICGGPHVGNTKELGKFKIVKQKGIAAGVRRIRAVLEKC